MLSIAGNFNWRKRLQAVASPFGAARAGNGPVCSCLGEMACSIWEQSPGCVVVMTSGGRTVWQSAKAGQLLGFAVNGSPGEDLPGQLPAGEREEFLGMLAAVAGSGVEQTTRLTLGRFRGPDLPAPAGWQAHVARHARCGRRNCEPRLVVTLLGVSGDALEAPADNSIHRLQSRVQDFQHCRSHVPGSPAGASETRERIDLHGFLKDAANRHQACFEFAGVECRIEQPTALPPVPVDTNALAGLAGALFRYSLHCSSTRPAIRIGLSRTARHIELHVRFASDGHGSATDPLPPGEARRNLEATAAALGQVRPEATGRSAGELRVAIPINATPVAPEPSNHQERVCRFANPANLNRGPKPLSEIQETG